MKRLSGIARDYLADFEILHDARTQFEEELTEWWQALANLLLPMTDQQNAIEIESWQESKNKGRFQLYAAESYIGVLEVLDPRFTGVRDYQLNIHASTGKIKAIREDKKLLKRLEEIKASEGLETLFPTSSRVAEASVEINPDDPEGTLRDVHSLMQKLFKLLLAIETAKK